MLGKCCTAQAAPFDHFAGGAISAIANWRWAENGEDGENPIAPKIHSDCKRCRLSSALYELISTHFITFLCIVMNDT